MMHISTIDVQMFLNDVVVERRGGPASGGIVEEENKAEA